MIGDLFEYKIKGQQYTSKVLYITACGYGDSAITELDLESTDTWEDDEQTLLQYYIINTPMDGYNLEGLKSIDFWI